MRIGASSLNKRLRSKRCVITLSLQILLVCSFLTLHLFFFSKKSEQHQSINKGNPLLKQLCPLLKEEDEGKEPKQSSYLDIDTSHFPWIQRGPNITLPQENTMSKLLQRRNGFSARNVDLFPHLPAHHMVIVLYVHNRPSYLRVAIEGLSKVIGISESLLIVSHDGFFEEMNAIIESIRFCRVKQIFAPFSPHIFTDSFPGISPGDCQNKEDPQNCNGKPDQYGNHRAPHIVSLKHHWWWMMNTVWDGLVETRTHHGHILFIEEDHYLLPNALLNIQTLTALKACKCPNCYMANLAPANVQSRGERIPSLIADKVGNIGYAFNRTIWRKIHSYSEHFCKFDDYNWDITMWAVVYPEWADQIYSLRGPRTSAQHFGKCGLHQGKTSGQGTCLDEGGNLPPVEDEDKILNINPHWDVRYNPVSGYNRGFKGWGGWGDERDWNLCLAFASMYLSGTRDN